MFNDFMPPLMLFIVCSGIYALFELFVRRKERMTIIEKIGDKLELGDMLSKKSLTDYFPKFSFGSLKTGCLLCGIGMGLLVAFLISLAVLNTNNAIQLHDYRGYEMISAMYGASILLFGGIGLIVAFVIELKLGRKDKP